MINKRKKSAKIGFIEYCRRPSFYITDKYIINKLFADGIPRHISISNPILIETERTKIKIKRLLKQKQNEKHERVKK